MRIIKAGPPLILIAASILAGPAPTCARLVAQSLPATSATSPASPSATPQPPAASAPAIHRAEVAFSDGKLAVVADNSSLNQILRDIGKATGIKITGGVRDERVFGSYGPADLSTVLGTLLDGTGSNMMLVAGSETTPAELFLTPRQGGPSPPSPSTFHTGNRNDDDLPPSVRLHDTRSDRTAGSPAPVPSGTLGPPPTAADPNENLGTQPSTAAQPSPETQQPGAPAANTTTDQSPNGVKTPQQIYDQLMQMQKQQATTPPK